MAILSDSERVRFVIAHVRDVRERGVSRVVAAAALIDALQVRKYKRLAGRRLLRGAVADEAHQQFWIAVRVDVAEPQNGWHG